MDDSVLRFEIISMILLVLIVYALYRLVRWIVGQVRRSIKAKQNLARAVADVSEKLEKIEHKLEAQDQPKI